ncbi:MAG: hypothetical protein J6U54_09975 [Clostridiales bacterium]|nr:hypothetical protein [Clostridiales bacterium]
MSNIQHGGISGSISDHHVSGTASAVQRITGSMNSGSSGGRKEVISNTTEAWNSNPRLKSIKDIVYVYTDYKVVNGQPVPGIKIGDGLAYVVDLPFVSSGTDITQEQIDFWNGKCSVMIDREDPEHAIFYTDQR